MKPPILIITGPTAAGKTALSIHVAKALGGEIISADSMQVYRHMDIGSAKIRPEEMDGVSHHLIDILEPEEDYNVMRFAAEAKAAAKTIAANGHLPIVAGGTGFYIQALLYDIAFTPNADDGSIRRELEERYDNYGADVLYDELLRIDPESAAIIHKNNKKRLVRALEYHALTGEKISDHNRTQRAREASYNFLYYCLTDERQVLYDRIDRRVDLMMEEGLLDEVKALRERGLDRTKVSMQGLGYKELLCYLDGECTLDEAIYTIKRDTRHFAKRQLTWFKRERDVRWIDKSKYNSEEDIAERIVKEANECLL